MKEELPKIPFNLIHEFVGSLSIENYSVDNLHIVLRHSLLDTDQITCKIFGNNETAKNIKPILKKNTASIKLKSNSNFEIFESNGVAINNVTEFYSPSYENIIPNCIAKLSLLNLKISNYREWDGVKRNIKFYLSGPVDLIHQIFPFKFKKYKDPFKYEADKNYIGLFDGLKIYIIKFEFYDESLDDKIIRSKSIVALQVETDDVEISDEEFIKKAKIVIDDVLLLASFIGKNWISWYGYLFETNKIVQEYFQIRSRKINEKANFYDLIIPFYKIRQFLRSSYKKFKKHNDSGFNIKMVIIYIINGNESNYLEAQFTTTFLALEKLKDIYSIKYGLDINMKKNNFNKFFI